MEHEAIYQLYPTVKQIQEDASGNYIARDVDSNEVAMKPTESRNMRFSAYSGGRNNLWF